MTQYPNLKSPLNLGTEYKFSNMPALATFANWNTSANLETENQYLPNTNATSFFKLLIDE